MTRPKPPSAGKPRLLVLTSTYPRWPGDPEPGFVHELARRLTSDFDARVIGPHAPGALRHERLDGVDVHRYRYAPARLETLVNDGGIVTNLRCQPWKWLLVPGFLLAQTWAIWRALRRFRPDVVHAHWLLPQGLVMALFSWLPGSPPFVVTSHGADLFALRAGPLRALKHFVARRAAAVTVVSQAMTDVLVHLGVDAGTLSVRPMGVDLRERFTPDPSVPRADDELLFVGRLVEKKGLRHLLDALPDIACHQPGVTLTIAGFGPEEPALRRQAEALGLTDRVRFIGAVPQADLPALYHRAALFVAPFVEAASGDQEGLGLVTVEAIGCGCPAVVGDVPATRGIDAVRVPPGDSTALAARIADCLALPAPERAALAEAQRRSVDAFDWETVAGGYAAVLRRLATQQPEGKGRD